MNIKIPQQGGVAYIDLALEPQAASFQSFPGTITYSPNQGPDTVLRLDSSAVGRRDRTATNRRSTRGSQAVSSASFEPPSQIFFCPLGQRNTLSV